ncbi:alpha/beta fold hydrolase [Nannocystis pusilla]|uniref:alpha/beta fold hydrolase n=1 Tax=Nannocystis pusilla TaxID=889268 RepID=UPI003DA3530F
MSGFEDIAVTRWGAAGPRIVLVHGGAQGSEVGGERHFSAQARLADRGFQLLVPDRPGHGRTPAPGRPDDAEADGEWVAHLLGDGAHLVGHSFGGCVALAAAARRPAAVRSLTLVEPAMLAVGLPHPAVLGFVLRTVLTLKLSRSPEARARRFAALMHIPADIRGGGSPAQFAAMGQAIEHLRVPARADLERELAGVVQANIPLLVVTGGWSRAMDIAAAKVASLGRGRLVTIPSPHHFPQLVSEEFNERLAAFVTAAARRSA